MPSVDNGLMLAKSMEEYENDPALKPLRFAESFEVNLTPDNNGTWTKNVEGYNIWQIRIESPGAYSLNLILKPYHLPEGARLFVYNQDRTHTIGAFTSFNNKSYNSLALSPVSGETVILQYEEPVNPEFKGELGISQVNHDFMGIVSDPTGRRPLGLSGSCNIDINCELGKKWAAVKNSVCRIVVAGKELCSGTLINNSKKDKTPYVITANHCFMKYMNGEQNTVYLFNYESPYCGALDGDVTNSVSGSLKIANSDSIDFFLVKLSENPPPNYRPFFAGWDRSGTPPDSVVSIHHPVGDIKKIALDYNSPVVATYKSTEKQYLTNGFWKTLTWEYGTTESGSSGSGYFDQNLRLIGTLTGGAAQCSNSVNDFFERLDVAWNHYTDSARQLKCWLDPLNSGISKLDGISGYQGENYCNSFTHLVDGDTPALAPMKDTLGNLLGFWGGTNQAGISEYTEKYTIKGNEILSGISIGVARIIKNTSGSGYITVKVYNGNQAPESLIYSKDVQVSSLVANAMNLVSFDQAVQPADTFFIGFDVSKVNSAATIVVYFANRKNNNNSVFFKQNNLWVDYHQATDTLSAAMALELLACNIMDDISDTPVVNQPADLLVFPNPASTVMRIRSKSEFKGEDVSIVDLLGRSISLRIEKTGLTEAKVDLTGNSQGIYFLRIKNKDISAATKFFIQRE
jgi:V8-like Glu-specific endopeptidase